MIRCQFCDPGDTYSQRGAPWKGSQRESKTLERSRVLIQYKNQLGRKSQVEEEEEASNKNFCRVKFPISRKYNEYTNLPLLHSYYQYIYIPIRFQYQIFLLSYWIISIYFSYIYIFWWGFGWGGDNPYLYILPGRLI